MQEDHIEFSIGRDVVAGKELLPHEVQGGIVEILAGQGCLINGLPTGIMAINAVLFYHLYCHFPRFLARLLFFRSLPHFTIFLVCVNYTFSVVVHKEKQWYVAECPEVGTVSQGKSIEEAVAHLKEATELYLEEFPLEEASQTFRTTFEAKSAA